MTLRAGRCVWGTYMLRQAGNDGVLRLVDLLDRTLSDGDRALSTLVCKALYNLCTSSSGATTEGEHDGEEEDGEGLCRGGVSVSGALFTAGEVDTLAGVLERAVDATRAAMSKGGGGGAGDGEEAEARSATEEEEAAEAAAFAELALQLHSAVLQVDVWEGEEELDQSSLLDASDARDDGASESELEPLERRPSSPMTRPPLT